MGAPSSVPSPCLVCRADLPATLPARRLTGKLFRAGFQTILAAPQDLLERLQRAESGEISIQVDNAIGWLVIRRTGATASVAEAFAREVRDFIDRDRRARLITAAALVAARRAHLDRYRGVIARGAPGRGDIVPPPVDEKERSRLCMQKHSS